uniref:Diacylglycerol kinase n=1 Tax=Arcella intermedia TaxID=1963864 RepID=A0A6B2L8A9_9EUKA
MCCINPNSGGGQGKIVCSKLELVLGEDQLCDLKASDPGAFLQEWRAIPNIRIVAAGGDGTISWVHSLVDAAGFGEVPVVVPFPLGTANDTSRALGWGGSYSGDNVSTILSKIEVGTVIDYDLWKIRVEPTDKTEENKVIKETIVGNYFSMGVDSEILLQFEQWRKENPDMTVARELNYVVYGLLGAKNMVSSYESFRHFCKLTVDGKEIEIPAGISCIVLMNIPSYSGGTNPWKNASNYEQVPSKVNQSILDETLEIFGMKGVFHLGRNTTNIPTSGGIRFCQGKHVLISLSKEMTMQVDGEAWVSPPCNIEMQFYRKVKMLYNSADDTTGMGLRTLLGAIKKKPRTLDD